MWAELGRIGPDPGGGYSRLAWSAADARLREWFRAQAAAREMAVEQDGNGNLWAWWPAPAGGEQAGGEQAGRERAGGGPSGGAVAVGSHLDSVPNGGAFDGPLGVVSAFLAVDEVRAKEGWRAGTRWPRRPVAVVSFSDEEGARFGVACVGSRLACGALAPDAARALVDAGGTTLAEAMRQAGADPGRLGPSPERLASLCAFVELHIEQGRALVDLGAPVGLATAIWPHGRWRCSFQGEPDHAGTTRLVDRKDPMLALAAAVIEARRAAEQHEARATFARVSVQPNATNAIAARVDAWLDARAADEEALQSVVAAVSDVAVRAAAAQGVAFQLTCESFTSTVAFDGALRARVAEALGGAPELPTGAGHDAGILSAHLPTAMIFVRNRTGVSHSPAESATVDDCLAGVGALARVLDALTAPDGPVSTTAP
jgi:N-carbamoyl-L-amino-acid hydrolase